MHLLFTQVQFPSDSSAGGQYVTQTDDSCQIELLEIELFNLLTVWKQRADV